MTSGRLFAAALVPYAVGIWWGLPEGEAGWDRPWGTDELGPVGAINEVYGVFAAREPVFNPQYPLFHYLVQLLFVAPCYVALWISGHISVPAPLFPYGLDHPTVELPLLTLAARLPSLLMAAGVVVLAYHTGAVLRDRRTGAWAALFVFLLFPMMYYARTSNVDMGALFWMAAGLLLFARCLAGDTPARRLMALAVCAALAAASKDAAYAAFVPVGALVAWWHARQQMAAGSSPWRAAAVPARALALSVATYGVASGLLFRPSRFLQHVQFITRGSGTAPFHFRYPPTIDGYLAFGREFAQQVVDAFGWPLLALTAAGLAWWVRHDRRLLLWTLPALSICVLVILPVRFALLRFVLPVAYVLVFAAADVAARLQARPRGALKLAGQVALVMAVGWSVLRGADLTHQMLRDSRDAASSWLARAALPGDTVGHFVLRHQVPALPAGVEAVSVRPDALAAGASRPEFLVSIPLEDFEVEHEQALPPAMFVQLLTGALGYREAAVVQTPSLLSRRPLTFVNPPVRIFARADLWEARPALREPTP